MRLLLDRLDPTPAAVVDRTGEVLAHSAGWARLFERSGVFESPPPNLVRFLFADRRAYEWFPDWDDVADQVATEMRADNRSDDPNLLRFLEGLGPDGAEALGGRLAAGPSVPRRRGVVRLVHPEAGELRLAHESMEVPDAEQRVVVHLPYDEATARALDELIVGRSGILRAVPG